MQRSFADVAQVVVGADGADDDELVAAVARQEVHLARAVGQDGRHEPQRLVAGGMAEGVVDRLEVVDVDMGHAEPLADAAVQAELLLEDDVDVAAVEQAGERVGHGRVGELLDEACHLAPGHRFELAEDLDAVEVAVDREAPRLDVHGEPLAVFALEEDLVHAARAPVGEALLERARSPVQSLWP